MYFDVDIDALHNDTFGKTPNEHQYIFPKIHWKSQNFDFQYKSEFPVSNALLFHP